MSGNNKVQDQPGLEQSPPSNPIIVDENHDPIPYVVNENASILNLAGENRQRSVSERTGGRPRVGSNSNQSNSVRGRGYSMDRILRQ